MSNFSAGSTVQIISLNGRVVKKFNLTYENSILNWDGKGDDGKILKTGIYLVTAYLDSKKVDANSGKKAYAIPSPGRNKQKGWVLDKIPLS